MTLALSLLEFNLLLSCSLNRACEEEGGCDARRRACPDLTKRDF